MPDSDVYAVKRFPVFIVFELVDDGIYGDGGFTHLTVADDELALAATYGYHRVDGFDTGLQGLFYRLAEDNAGGFAVEGHEDGVAGNGPCAVDGFAQRVDDTTEQPFAYGDRGDVAGAASCHVFGYLLDIVQEYDSHIAFFEVHGNAAHAVLKLYELTGLYVVETVDVGNAVAYFEHRAYLLKVGSCVYLFEFAFQYVGYLAWFYHKIICLVILRAFVSVRFESKHRAASILRAR